MHLIDAAGHLNNQFVHEDPATNRPPTEINAAWLNAVQNELANTITGFGLVLDKSDQSQLLKAITTFAGQAKAMADVYASVPTEFKSWTILVTSPHLRVMVWSTLNKKYIRAPWHQPGRLQHFLRDVPYGFAEVRSDVVLNKADFPDLAEYLGVAGPTFVLDEARGEFLRSLDSGRGVDSGRTPGSWKPDSFREHAHGMGLTASTGGNSRFLAPPGAGANFSAWSDSIKPEGGAETAPRHLAYRLAVTF